MRYANAEAFKHIRSLSNDYVQQYLGLRKAAVVLKQFCTTFFEQSGVQLLAHCLEPMKKIMDFCLQNFVRYKVMQFVNQAADTMHLILVYTLLHYYQLVG